MRRADLTGANFEGSDLTAAKLRGAQINSTNLRKVDLSSTEATFAVFKSVILTGAQFGDAHIESSCDSQTVISVTLKDSIR